MKQAPVSGRKRLLALGLDALLFATSYAFAFLIRLDLTPYPAAWTHFEATVLTVVAVKTVVFVLAGTYRGLMVYATLPDLLTLVRQGTLASVLLLGLFQVLPGHRPYSRGVLVIDWLLTVALLSTARVIFRMRREGVLEFSRTSRAALKRVLIVGGGLVGEVVEGVAAGVAAAGGGPEVVFAYDLAERGFAFDFSGARGIEGAEGAVGFEFVGERREGGA